MKVLTRLGELSINSAQGKMFLWSILHKAVRGS